MAPYCHLKCLNFEIALTISSNIITPKVSINRKLMFLQALRTSWHRYKKKKCDIL